MHTGTLKRGLISNPAALAPPQADFPEDTTSAKAQFTSVRIRFLHLSRYSDTSTDTRNSVIHGRRMMEPRSHQKSEGGQSYTLVTLCLVRPAFETRDH